MRARKIIRSSRPEVFRKKCLLKARIHCEIFLSDYFMKHNLMHISLHIIGFDEVYVKYVKRNPSRTIKLFFPRLFYQR